MLNVALELMAAIVAWGRTGYHPLTTGATDHVQILLELGVTVGQWTQRVGSSAAGGASR